MRCSGKSISFLTSTSPRVSGVVLVRIERKTERRRRSRMSVAKVNRTEEAVHRKPSERGEGGEVIAEGRHKFWGSKRAATCCLMVCKLGRVSGRFGGNLDCAVQAMPFCHAW